MNALGDLSQRKQYLIKHTRFDELRRALRRLGAQKETPYSLARVEKRENEATLIRRRKMAADLCCEMRVKKLNEREIIQNQLTVKSGGPEVVRL